ncbi:MAG: DUF1580 domain-containing protein [Planctomycetota bacterium]
MNADPTGNDLVALRDVPAILPRRRGKKTHYSTVYRWVTKGARGKKLESRLVGGVRYTTRVALQRFLQDDPCSSDQRPVAEQLRQALYEKSGR